MCSRSESGKNAGVDKKIQKGSVTYGVSVASTLALCSPAHDHWACPIFSLNLHSVASLSLPHRCCKGSLLLEQVQTGWVPGPGVWAGCRHPQPVTPAAGETGQTMPTARAGKGPSYKLLEQELCMSQKPATGRAQSKQRAHYQWLEQSCRSWVHAHHQARGGQSRGRASIFHKSGVQQAGFLAIFREGAWGGQRSSGSTSEIFKCHIPVTRERYVFSLMSFSPYQQQEQHGCYAWHKAHTAALLQCLVAMLRVSEHLQYARRLGPAAGTTLLSTFQALFLPICNTYIMF